MSRRVRRSLALFTVLSVAVGVAWLAAGASAQSKAEAREKVEAMLKDAALAQESWRTEHPAYTDDKADLKKEGWPGAPGPLRMTIPHANKLGYCMNGSHESLRKRYHYDSDVGAPQEGRCPENQ